MGREEILQRKPIRELEIEVSPEYAPLCICWLQSQGGGMEPVEEKRGFYRVTFPEGTVEEARSGQSGLYTQQISIVLPDGLELQKMVMQPLNSKQRRRVTMSFPKEIFG